MNRQGRNRVADLLSTIPDPIQRHVPTRYEPLVKAEAPSDGTYQQRPLKSFPIIMDVAQFEVRAPTAHPAALSTYRTW